MLWTILLPILAYLLGSIPFGLVLGKAVKGIDLREVGSGNIGTANAVRALGPFWGGVTLVGDALKSVIPVTVAMNLPRWIPGSVPEYLVFWLPCLVGLMAVVGHNNSIFLNFTGGKGIATSFGVFLAMEWRAALLGIALYGIIISVSKISSLGSLLGSLSIPLFMFLFKSPVQYVVFAAVAVILAFYKHRENISRLMKGEERKITDKARKDSEDANAGNDLSRDGAGQEAPMEDPANT